MLAHSLALIDAAAPACVAAKPQLACFERLGFAGALALEAVVARARAAGLLVLADGKRGDVPVTATAYAQALTGRTPSPFGPVPGLGVDALTANPLPGQDALEPLIDGARAAGAGVFVLVRTSNPGAADLMDLPLSTGEPLWERLARLADGLGRAGAAGLKDVGAVTGATAPEHLARMRELMPQTPFLLPGVGAQGGDVGPAPAGLRARPRRRPRHRLALDRPRARADRRRPRRRRSPGGRATAHHSLGARLRAPAKPPEAPLSSPSMGHRSPARFLAPLALVAVGIALFMVVTSPSTEPETTAPNRATETQPTGTPDGDGDGERRERKGPRRYTVEPGDTPSSIAEETGVPLEEILRLNPDLDPQTLSPGQRIKLRQ